MRGLIVDLDNDQVANVIHANSSEELESKGSIHRVHDAISVQLEAPSCQLIALCVMSFHRIADGAHARSAPSFFAVS